MKGGKRKFNAIFLVVCLFVSAFVAMASIPAMAHENVGGDIRANWVDSWMEEQPELPAAVDKLIQFNYDSSGGDAYHLGDEDVAVWITLYNSDNTDEIYVGDATLESNNALFTPNQDEDDGNTIWDLGSYTFQFTIDIGTSGQVNTLYADALRLRLENMEQPTGTSIGDETFDFDIYVSSVFDDDFPDSDADEHEDLPYIDETDSDPEFEAGVDMQEGEIWLTEYASYDITDVEGTLSTFPSGISPTGNYDTAVNPGGGGTFNLVWRFDVTSGTDPGEYSMDIAFQYIRDDTGETINEAARPTGLIVDFTPRVTASLASPVEIDQMDLTATLDVIFTNDGNVDLLDLVVMPDVDGDWLDVKFHHYENDDDVYVTEMDIGDLDVGDSSSAVEVVIAANMMLPNGTHRLPFAWNAWYFQTRVTGLETRWIEIGGLMYNHDGNSATEEVGLVYEDVNENGIYDFGDILLEPVWEGAYVDFTVIDDTPTLEAFMFDVVEAGVGGDVTYTTIEIILFNREMVDYKDLEVELEVGPNSPFLDPADHTATRLMMHPMSDTDLDSEDTAEIYFTVDVNAAWWQTDAEKPGTHEVRLWVDATNDYDETRFYDQEVMVDVNIDGFGPELFAYGVSYDKITPGKPFTLDISIMNYGDDIARDVNVYLRADFVSGWSIVDQFVTSISSYEVLGNDNIGDASWGWVSDWDEYIYFNRSNEIMPNDLDVDNIPEMVEIYDWIKRRETPPQGVVLWIHLNRLGPGNNHTFTFEMQSDVNMVEGMAYYTTLELYYVDSNGETYGPNDWDYDYYTPPQQVLVRTKGEGEKYTAKEEPIDPAVVLYAVIFVIIAFIIFIIGYALGRGAKGGEPRREEPYRPYEDEEDYGPPLEEEGEPPLPEEKPPE